MGKKKVADMTPEECKHSRALANARQQRRRKRLLATAPKEYRSQCATYHKRYMARKRGQAIDSDEPRPTSRKRKRIPTQSEEEDIESEEDPEPSPTQQRRVQLVFHGQHVGDDDKVRQEQSRLRPRPRLRKLPSNAASSSGDEDVDTDNEDHQGLTHDEDEDVDVDTSEDEDVDVDTSEDEDDLGDDEYVGEEESEDSLDNDVDGSEAGEHGSFLAEQQAQRVPLHAHTRLTSISKLSGNSISTPAYLDDRYDNDHDVEESHARELPTEDDDRSHRGSTFIPNDNESVKGRLGALSLQSRSQTYKGSSGPVLDEPHTPPAISPLSSIGATSCQLDLVTGVHGIQVHSRAQTIQWTSGHTTVLPFLQTRDKKRRVRNVLNTDAAYTKLLAKLPTATFGSSLVVFLNKNVDKLQLFRLAREALSQDKVVVVEGYVDTHGFDLTAEHLEEHFGISPNRMVQAHDMARRVTDFSQPYVDTTVQEFVDDITNVKVSRVALGFPLPQLSAPWPFQKLDDGLSLGWAQTQNLSPIDKSNLPPDIWTVRSWGLPHHAAILTFGHHDAEGAGTWLVMESGVKLWSVQKISGVTRDEIGNFLANLSSDKFRLDDPKGRIKAETITLYPGTLLIMPPGKHHAVFTPIAGFSRGGHYFNLDTMHLTELSRWADKTHGKFITNDTHRGTLETLCRLVISLTILPKSRRLYKRSIVALCGMVVHHDMYTAQNGPTLTSETLPMATNIANTVLHLYDLLDFEAYLSFLKQGDPFDRGEEVELHDLFHSLHTD